MFKVKNKNTNVVLFLLLTLNIFYTFFQGLPRQSAIAEANAEANSIFLGKKIAKAIYAQWKFFFFTILRDET